MNAVKLYQYVFSHPKVGAAWRLAAELHQEDTYGDRAYISHLHEVAEQVFWSFPGQERLFVGNKIANNELMDRLVDEVCAGFLHDVIEDHGDKISIEDIEQRFGKRVGVIVELSSDIDVDRVGEIERNASNWRERKQFYLDRLHDKRHHLHDSDVVSYLRVSCADKLANSKATLMRHRDSTLNGGEGHFWSRFKASKNDRLWYDNQLANIFNEILENAPKYAIPQLESLVIDLRHVTDQINMRSSYGQEASLADVAEGQQQVQKVAA